MLSALNNLLKGPPPIELTTLPNAMEERPAHIINVTAQQKDYFDAQFTAVQEMTGHLNQWTNKLKDVDSTTESSEIKQILADINMDGMRDTTGRADQHANSLAFRVSEACHEMSSILVLAQKPPEGAKNKAGETARIDADDYISSISESAFNSINNLRIKLKELSEITGQSKREQKNGVLGKLPFALDNINSAVNRYVEDTEPPTESEFEEAYANTITELKEDTDVLVNDVKREEDEIARGYDQLNETKQAGWDWEKLN